MNTHPSSPPGPGNSPPFDELSALRDGPHAFLLKIARAYGPILRYPVGPPIGPGFAFYLVSDPEGVKHVLQDNAKNYSKDTFQYNLLSTITGRGLLTNDGDAWLRQRRLAQPAFHKERIAGFGPLMAGYIEAMLTRWDAHAGRGAPLDVAEEMMHVALQIVAKALFSVEIGDGADELAQATLTVLDHIVGRARTFGIVSPWLPTPGNLRYRRAMGTLEGAVNATIARRRSAPPPPVPASEPAPPSPLPAGEGGAAHPAPRRGGEGREVDLLAMLMSARDAETGEGTTVPEAQRSGTIVPEAQRSGMSDRQLRDEVMTLLIAGHETVASALAWAWHLLAAHPDAEAKLHAELADVLGGRPPAAADLPRLPYTRAVFEEALRLYPPAWIITRKALADDEIAGYRIPANALVVASPYVTHRQAAYWPEPEAFNPDRFTAERAAGRPRFAFYPFGGGPRLCIGDQFAFTEAGLLIATAAQRYRLRSVPGHPVAVEPGVTLRPKHGLMMTLEKR